MVWWHGNHLSGIPVLLFPCLNGITSLDLTNHTIVSSAHGTIWPAVQNLLLACRAEGLGATLTTLHLVFEEPINALLEIPEGARSVGMVPIGWPMGTFGSVKRKPIDDVLVWNRWA